MTKGYNKDKQFFAQSYEDQDILDSSLLIMPLVFFSTPVRAVTVPWIRIRNCRGEGVAC